MIMHFNSYIDILQYEFSRRNRANTSYGLRAFARDLKVSASRLSQIFNGKLGLSVMSAKLITKNLGYREDESEYFCSLVELAHSRSKKNRAVASDKISKIQSTLPQINLEQIAMLGNWKYYAILELTQLKDFLPNTSWVAKKLGISQDEAKSALQSLFKLGLLKEVDGSWMDSQMILSTPDDIESHLLRDLHAQLLTIAKDKIVKLPTDSKESGSVVFSFEEDQMDSVKKILRDARKQLVKLCARPSVNKDRVYCAQFMLFPLDEKLV